ncbi:glycosyltransferase family 2 protein [Shewanella saliphila]|uniref:Glycosyltransferase 2-like domain-containing protein n=1 Tax=Shewanella saliphila TaxID=2282698 RepID=A0ABQ2Q4L0_9GAMM|nr:glycosyltransferase family 2 protein [Shewanella saliphila]MCL1101353.1 glycosyltransferase family 2 protein [Shewanella saliphila]GGP50328.1 hypothetical protein GCM10009409_16030 [Shewanella saliphila]
MSSNNLKVSFCIPIKNRLGDIKSTLKKNLLDNVKDSDIVEFIVICFDDDGNETSKWVQENFPEELKSGYLRYYYHDDLPVWHFGKAKNAFKKYIKGKIYASLDGDNFVGKGAGKHIVEIFERYDYNCVLHQFQGNWGDGTCGRISINAEDYIRWGYDEDFLPRQWDEMDAMLSVLVNKENVKYIHYTGEGKNIIKKSHPFRRYLDEHAIEIEQIALPESENNFFMENAAVGEHDNSYVEDDARLRLSSIYNHLLSYLKNSTDKVNRSVYLSEILQCQKDFTEQIDPSVNLSLFLSCDDVRVRNFNPEPNSIMLVSCIKDENDIHGWLEHYRRLGVNFFLLVDDNSEKPLDELLSKYNDVFVFSPKVGQFKFAKTMWLECLLNRFCLDSWTYIVDSDEYAEPCFKDIDLRSPNSTLNLTKRNKGKYYSGFMLDLYPNNLTDIENVESTPITKYTHYQFRPKADFEHYHTHNTTKWSYGAYSDWAYQIDIRYRTNKTFDSMRKFPLVKWESKMHLNQGFHDLIINGDKRTYNALESTELMPIRHYKYRSIASQISGDSAKNIAQYHDDTKRNIESAIKNFNTIIKECVLNPFSFEFISPLLVPTPYNSYVSLVKDEINVPTYSGHTLLYNEGAVESIRGNIVIAPTFNDAICFILNNSPFRNLVSAIDSTAVFSTVSDVPDNDNITFGFPIFQIGLAGTGSELIHEYLTSRNVKSILWSPEDTNIEQRKSTAKRIHTDIMGKIHSDYDNPIESISAYDAICDIGCVIHNFEKILAKYPESKVIFTSSDFELLKGVNRSDYDDFYKRVSEWCEKFGPDKWVLVNPINDGFGDDFDRFINV